MAECAPGSLETASAGGFRATAHYQRNTKVALRVAPQPGWRGLISRTNRMVKNPPATPETWVQSLGGEDPLGEETGTHSGILARRTAWTKEPGGLQSTGSQSRT